MNIDTAVDKLNAALKLITEAMAILERETPSVPKEASLLVEKGICLNCRKPFSDSERRIRGLHERCYRRIMRRIEDGHLTEAELIEAGLIAPPGAEKKVIFKGDKLDAYEDRLKTSAKNVMNQAIAAVDKHAKRRKKSSE